MRPAKLLGAGKLRGDHSPSYLLEKAFSFVEPIFTYSANMNSCWSIAGLVAYMKADLAEAYVALVNSPSRLSFRKLA